MSCFPAVCFLSHFNRARDGWHIVHAGGSRRAGNLAGDSRTGAERRTWRAVEDRALMDFLAQQRAVLNPV